MNWKNDMAHAYSVGLEDGKSGHYRGSPNDFRACYEQGLKHGKRSEFSVSFQCKPGNHWRSCTDTVTATSPGEAVAIIAATNYGMPTRGLNEAD